MGGAGLTVGPRAAPPRRDGLPLLMPRLGLAGGLSVPVLVALGFYRPKFDQLPGLEGASFAMNFVWMGIAVAASLTWLIVRNGARAPRQSAPVLAGLAAFFAYSLFSLSWSPDPMFYGVQKNLMAIASFGASAVCMTAVCAGGRRAVERFFRFIVLYALALSAVVLVMGGPFAARYGFSLSGDYQMISRVIAMGMATVIAGYVAWPGGAWRAMLAALVCGFMLSALLVAGGRTGLVSAVIVAALLVASRIGAALGRARAPLGLVLSCAAAATAGAAYLVTLDPAAAPATLRRILHILEPGNLEEFNRLQRVVAFPRLFAEAPLFGHGSGSWEAIERKGMLYPHNIAIEVLAELGIVGAVLLAMVFRTALASMRHYRRGDYHGTLNACCWAYFLIACAHSMAMGDFSLNFGLYSALFLMAMRPAFLVRAAAAREPAECVARGIRPGGPVSA